MQMTGLMERLAPEVADFFPVTKGETFAEYAARAVASELSTSQRAVIGGYVVTIEKEFHAKRQAEKEAWIAAARVKFRPGPRQACEVCGKYAGLAEAHHIVPLAVQFESGAETPGQECIWLCPTHHAGQHAKISNLLRHSKWPLDGMPPEEADALDKISVKFVEMFTKLPKWSFRQWRR